MRINHIEIENYKGFEKERFEFPSNFTLIHGANATGKTTILDAVAISVNAFLTGVNPKEVKLVEPADIRRIIFKHSVEHQFPVRFAANVVIDDKSFEMEQVLETFGISKGEIGGIFEMGLSYAKEVRNKENSDKVILPLIAYHGTGRLWTDIEEKDKYEKRSSRLDGYDNCLDSKSIRQRFFHWFKTLEDNALKFKKDDGLYEAFTIAITTIVEDWTKINFSWELEDIIGMTANGEYKAYENLSDGYKTLVTLAADLAYRCIKLNPQLKERAVKDTPGIVLIDELDMHLHPKWQREVVAQLKAAFPKVQFIATSHSPYIIQSLNADELISLDGEVLDQNPKDQSLDFTTAYMGVSSYRSAEFEEKERNAQEVYKKIEAASKQEGEEQELTLDEIDELIEKYSNDPAYVAELKFKKLAKLGNQ